MRLSAWMIGAVVGAVVLLGTAAALLYANGGLDGKAAEEAPAQSDLARFATGPLATLHTPAVLPATPDYVFADREGAETRFEDFRGRVVVVNLWAMWCRPCRTEMPTLAQLAQTYAQQPDLVVLPINVDRTETEIASARSFLDVHEPLPFYSDPAFRLPFEFEGRGRMPQTILIDRQGRVRAWFEGESDWSSPEARALIDHLLAEPA